MTDLALRLEMRPQQGVLAFSALGPDATQGGPGETAPLRDGKNDVAKDGQ